MKSRPLRDPEPELPLFASGSAAPAAYTVTQLTGAIRTALTQALPATLYVVGQISNYKHHASGHVYFTLKDENSEIACVMWRTAVQYLKFNPTDGLEVLVTATIDVYERSGRYQLYVRKIEPRGVGALELAFRQLHAKLAGDGLFDPTRKKPLPAIPRRVAVVTSPTGAAIRDILTTLKRRFPLTEVLRVPVSVQGDGSAAELTQAIRKLNAWTDPPGGVDVIIIGRGGGSIEDLWAFNDEQLARAIFDSRIPIISAVGHETDVTICDLVADVRAATPTAAAELAVPEASSILANIDGFAARLTKRLAHGLSLSQAKLNGLTQRSWCADPFMTIVRRAQRVEDAAQRVSNCTTQRHRFLVDHLYKIECRLRTIEPGVLAERKRNQLIELTHRLNRALDRRVMAHQRRLEVSMHRLERLHLTENIRRRMEIVATLNDRIAFSSTSLLRSRRDGLEARSARLEALSHHGVLRRGFSITRDLKTGKLVRAAADAHAGDLLQTETADGRIESRVIDSPSPRIHSGGPDTSNAQQ